MREFKVLSGVFSAEFGRGAGVVSVSTKSGTNVFHGTAFEYLRNDAFDARNFFVRKTLADGSLVVDPKPPLDRQPVRRRRRRSRSIDSHSRTFFFADYSGLHEKRGQVFVNTVPTARTRIGDFSDFRDASGNLITIYDPLTTRTNPAFNPSLPVSATNPQFLRDPYPGNMIPATASIGVGRNVASIYPLPNGAGQLQQLHVHRQPRDDRQRRSRGASTTGFSDNDSFFGPLQLRPLHARRAAGPGRLLFADAG